MPWGRVIISFRMRDSGEQKHRKKKNCPESLVRIVKHIQSDSAMIEKRFNHDFLFILSGLYFRSSLLAFFRLLPQLLPLDLVHEIEVGLVKVVDTDVTVLTTGGVCGTGGVHVDGVEGTEVTTDTANLVFEDLVVEAGLELTLTGRGGCDIHGGLTTTQDNVVLLSGNGSRVEGGIGDVGLEDGEVACRNELERKNMLAVRHWDGLSRAHTLADLSLEAVMK